MKYIAAMALMLNLGAAGIYAHDRPVKMRSSGTAGLSAVDLQIPDRTTGEDNFAGNGNLGSFTFRELEAFGGPPQRSSTCSGATQLYLTLSVGAGVFRFQDGSLLFVTLTEGADCIDLLPPEGPGAHCTRSFNITGGTGRFEKATGRLTFTETLVPLLTNLSGAPVFFASTGEFTGTVSGAAEEERQDDRQ